MPQYRLEENDDQQTFRLLMSLIVPRPIAWVSTYHRSGIVNLAPYALFSFVSSDPFTVQYTSRKPKDSLHNTLHSNSFCVNFTQTAQKLQVKQSSAELPAEESEAEALGIETVPADLVNAPRLPQAIASLECVLTDTYAVGSSTMVFGEIKRIHHQAGLLAENGLAQIETLDPLSKLGGVEWGKTTLVYAANISRKCKYSQRYK